MPIQETFGSGDRPDAVGGSTASAGALETTLAGVNTGTGSTGLREMLNSMTTDEQAILVRQMREDSGAEHEYARFFHEYETLDEISAAIAEYEAEKQAQIEAEEAAYEAHQAELAQREADMAAAHARGEAFHWDDTTYYGESVQEWILPGGTTILVNDAGEAVRITYPPGEGPVYQGDVMYQGEVHALYETPTGAMVLIDPDGTTVAYDELALDEIVVSKYAVTGDMADLADEEFVTVHVVPMGPPSYDTRVVDAETGEVYRRYNTGTHEEITGLSTYVPMGAESGYYINANGEPYAEYVPPPEEVWSILGVTYYEDGNVSVDLGVVELNVDLIGPEKGVSVELELLLGEGTAGIQWNEDGSWEFIAEVDLDTGVFELGVETFIGRDEKGNMYGGFEADTKVNLGMLTVEGGMYGNLQMTGDGFEASMGQWGEVGAFGAYIRRADDLTIVYDEGEGVTATQTFTLGAGIKGLGEIAVTTQTQLHTDGTWGGTSAGGGAHIAANDSDGNQLAGTGIYKDSDGETWTSSGLMDDGTGYRSERRDQLPPEGDGSADFQFGDGSGAADEGGRARPGLGGDRDGARRFGGDDMPRPALDELRPDGLDRRGSAQQHTLEREIDPLTPIGDAEMDASTPKRSLLDKSSPKLDEMDASTPKLADGALAPKPAGPAEFIGETEKNLRRDVLDDDIMSMPAGRLGGGPGGGKPNAAPVEAHAVAESTAVEATVVAESTAVEATVVTESTVVAATVEADAVYVQEIPSGVVGDDVVTPDGEGPGFAAVFGPDDPDVWVSGDGSDDGPAPGGAFDGPFGGNGDVLP